MDDPLCVLLAKASMQLVAMFRIQQCRTERNANTDERTFSSSRVLYPVT